MNKKQKQIGKEVIKIVRSRLPSLEAKEKKFVLSKLNLFLKNNSAGILILSDFDDVGQTDLKLSMVRTHEKHTKETFQELFKREPEIKKIIQEIFDEEQKQDKKDNITLRSVA